MTTPRKDFSEIYRDTFERIRDLLDGADPDTPVPATPGWTVKDVAAHQAGVLKDLSTGRLDGMPGERWTLRQVRERNDLSLEECLSEWDANFEAAKPMISTPAGGTLVADIVSHEHDLRSALGRSDGRDSEAVQTAAKRMLRGLDMKVKTAGLPAIRVITEGTEFIAGDGEPAVTLKASSFDVMRAISGRRSPAQVRKLGWEGAEPDQWLPAFFMFGPAEADVIE